MQLLLILKSRAPVSLIRACPWACEENSNSYWSDQARPICSCDIRFGLLVAAIATNTNPTTKTAPIARILPKSSADEEV
jgi:hypothetical protein